MPSLVIVSSGMDRVTKCIDKPRYLFGRGMSCARACCLWVEDSFSDPHYQTAPVIKHNKVETATLNRLIHNVLMGNSVEGISYLLCHQPLGNHSSLGYVAQKVRA